MAVRRKARLVREPVTSGDIFFAVVGGLSSAFAVGQAVRGTMVAAAVFAAVGVTFCYALLHTRWRR